MTGHIPHQMYPSIQKPQIYTVCVPGFHDAFHVNLVSFQGCIFERSSV